MRTLTLLALATTAACTSEGADTGTATGSLSIFREPCDLSEVTAVDSLLTGQHHEVENGQFFVNGVDVTYLMAPLLCTDYEVEHAIRSAEQGDWVVVPVSDAEAGVFAGLIADGDRTRLTFELRAPGNGQLNVFRGDVLARTRSWESMGYIVLPGTELRLDQPFEQLAAGQTKFVANEFRYTFE